LRTIRHQGDFQQEQDCLKQKQKQQTTKPNIIGYIFNYPYQLEKVYNAMVLALFF